MYLIFPLSHDSSPPVVSMAMMKYSTIRLAAFVDFSKAPYSSILTSLYLWLFFFNVVRMNQIIMTGYRLDTVIKTHSIVVVVHTIVRMELKHKMIVTK